MIAQILYKDNWYKTDLSRGIDLSISLGNVRCFFAPPAIAEPFKMGDFIGSVKSGAPVNYFNLHINPHGNGTHTECVGHVTLEQNSVNTALTEFHHIAMLITTEVSKMENGDQVITLQNILEATQDIVTKSLIIRTKPNVVSKKNKDYTDTNPPYLSIEAMTYLVESGIQHLLIDLPSVDREYDEGKLACHHIFWNTNGNVRHHATITELIFVPNDVIDGLYLLNMQVAPIELDASPSRPVIFALDKIQTQN